MQKVLVYCDARNRQFERPPDPVETSDSYELLHVIQDIKILCTF